MMDGPAGFADKITFSGHTAIVTGAASGIGAATAARLGRNGVNVIIADIDAAGAEAAAASIVDTGGVAKPFVMDVADPAQCSDVVEFARAQFGGLHYALNNVALSSAGNTIADMDIDVWRRAIDVCLNGMFYGMHYQIPAILASGGGSIVNVSSVAGLRGTVRNSAYVTAKHAIVGLTKAAAMEYAAQGIRVNSIHPGYIDTPKLRAVVSQQRRDQLAARHPVGRLGTAAEVANLAAFLFSDAAAFMTGGAHVVDGGFTAGYIGAQGNETGQGADR